MNSSARQKTKEIFIPNYSLGEELCNSISHGIGAGLGIAALVLCVIKAAVKGMGAAAVTAAAVYGASLVLLYAVSAVYHGLRVTKAKRVFRVLDHCTIYLLIAGTYTPYTVVALRNATGAALFTLIWGMAALSIALNAVDLKRYRVISFIAYLVMGWAIVFAAAPLSTVIGTGGMTYLLGGGALYTLGCIFYGVGRSHRYMHSLFHLFVLAGSVMHFVSIYAYVY